MSTSQKLFSEIINFARDISKTSLKSNILLISDMTLEPVFVESLKYVLYDQLTISADVILKSYDEILSSQKLEATNDWTIIINDFSECLSSINYNDEIKERELQKIDIILTKIKEENDRPILIALPENRSYPLDNIIISDIRARMMSIPQHNNNCYLLDMNIAVMQVGENQFYDYRKKLAFNIPYSPQGSLAFAELICGVMRENKGNHKKCLVLDCDNVLWGGVLEEVGISGIHLDTTFPGNQYLNFQKELLKLYHCGVIITLCSKNNHNDVIEVLRNHPFMVIKEEHVAAHRINWNNKADNIKQISSELNISLKDMVFVDDSEFEIGLVNDILPEVTTIHLPETKPYEFSLRLKNCGLFKTSNHTEDDLLRNSTYQNEKKRRVERERYFNYEEYLESLDIIMNCTEVTEFTAPRISQLTHRTNKANLTCKKLSTDEILQNSQQSNYWIRCFELSDKFGNYGFVGALVINLKDDKLNIEGFYLSCRALGRNVEKMMLDYAIENIESNYQNITYDYIDNGKNQDLERLINEYVDNVNQLSARKM